MAEISESRKQERAARINRRAQNYINGDISLDTFIMLEQLDNEDEADIVEALAKEREKKEAEIEQAERRKEADKLCDLLAHDEAETKQEPKQAAPKKREPIVPDLVNMTKEEFSALSLYEQNEYYKIAPNRVREIVNSDRPAYMDIIDPKPKPRDFKGVTLEEFKKMHLPELQELYDADPALYKQLRDEREAESTK
jgi:hypothetical protein